MRRPFTLSCLNTQAIEATQKAAAALKISKKVNYDALKQLLGDEGDTDGAADEGNDADADW